MFDDRQLNWLSVSMILEERSSSGGRIYIVPGGEKPFLLSYFHSSSRHRCLSYPRFRSFPISLEREGEGERRRLGVIWRNNGVDKLDLRGSPKEEGKIEIRVSSKCLHGNSCAPAINQNFFFFFSILISVRATLSSLSSFQFLLLLPHPVSTVHSPFISSRRKSFEESRGRKGESERYPRSNALNSRNSIRYRPHQSFGQPDTMTNEGNGDIYIYMVYRRRKGKKRFFYLAVRRESGHKGLKG